MPHAALPSLIPQALSRRKEEVIHVGKKGRHSKIIHPRHGLLILTCLFNGTLFPECVAKGSRLYVGGLGVEVVFATN